MSKRLWGFRFQQVHFDDLLKSGYHFGIFLDFLLKIGQIGKTPVDLLKTDFQGIFKGFVKNWEKTNKSLKNYPCAPRAKPPENAGKTTRKQGCSAQQIFCCDAKQRWKSWQIFCWDTISERKPSRKANKFFVETLFRNALAAVWSHL